MNWLVRIWITISQTLRPRRARVECLGIADFLDLARRRSIARGAGDDPHVIDMPALVEVVDHAEKLVDADPRADVPAVAAAYVTELTYRAPFESSYNFTVAVEAVYLLASVNGWTVDQPRAAWRPFMLDMAAGELTADEVARLITAFLRRRRWRRRGDWPGRL